MDYFMGIANRAYDEDGAVMIRPKPATKIREGARRMTRNKTLDGGVVITDSGLSAGDRTLDIRVSSTRELWQSLWALLAGATWVTVSTDEACYLAKIESMRESDGEIAVTILVKEDLSA